MSEPPNEAASRPYEEVFTDAVRVLTEAVGLTRVVYEPAAPDQAPDLVSEAWASTVGQDGEEVPRDIQDVRSYVDTGRREPADFAEFVAQVLVDVAGDVGGVQTMMAGASGSREAHAVRQMLLRVARSAED